MLRRIGLTILAIVLITSIAAAGLWLNVTRPLRAWSVPFDRFEGDGIALAEHRARMAFARDYPPGTPADAVVRLFVAHGGSCWPLADKRNALACQYRHASWRSAFIIEAGWQGVFTFDPETRALREYEISDGLTGP